MPLLEVAPNHLDFLILAANNSNATTVDDAENTVLWDLTKTIINTMSIIFLGYLARLTGYISVEAEKGIGQLAGRVALPALLANLVASANMFDVDFTVVLIDLCCKIVVIAMAAMIACISPAEGISRLTTIGAYGVFVTNSNYMAIGVPLISQIFPDRVLYLVMFSIVQLVIINPPLFIVILCGQSLTKSHQKHLNDESEEDTDELREVLLPSLMRALIRVGTDPVVLSAVIGLSYNLMSVGAIPETISLLCKTVGKAFALCALFGLGMGIYGHVDAIFSKGIVTPLLLITLKSFILPLMEKYVADLIGVQQDLSEVLWVAGTIGTAASTAILVSQFAPELGGSFRGATVLNLIIGVPFLLLSGLLFTSDEQTRKDITQHGRDFGNILSIIGLCIVFFNFCAVPRWRRYPMWIILDLAVIGIPFYIGHYLCHNIDWKSIPGGYWDLMYFITNVSRLARRGYMLAVGFILLAQVQWDKWFPDIPYGYGLLKKVSGSEEPSDDDSKGLAYNTKMRQLHWVSRCFALVYGLVGTIPFMLYVQRDPNEGFSCWCAYGETQFVYECVSFGVFTILQGYMLLRAILWITHGNDTHAQIFQMIKFQFGVIVTFQFVSLVTHIVVILRILTVGAENFEVDKTWLQPLILLIIATDGGGFVLMFVFQTSNTTWAAYRQCCYGAWLRIAGRTPTRDLRNYALKMSTDPQLVEVASEAQTVQDETAYFEEKIAKCQKELDRLQEEFKQKASGAEKQVAQHMTYLAREKRKTYSDAFSGSAAVDWMLGNTHCDTRDEASRRCVEMMNKCLLVQSGSQPIQPFLDNEDCFYRIKVPDFFRSPEDELNDDAEDEEEDESDEEGLPRRYQDDASDESESSYRGPEYHGMIEVSPSAVVDQSPRPVVQSIMPSKQILLRPDGYAPVSRDPLRPHSFVVHR